MFNDRVRRYRPAALLVLAALALFGLGAGHFATQGVEAQQGSSTASAHFADRAGDGWKSDDGRDYVHGIDCVYNAITNTGRWHLLTRSNCPTYRHFRLVLNPVSVSSSFPGCSVNPHPNYATAASPPLNICGNETGVWAQISDTPFPKKPDEQGPGQGTEIYLRTDTERDPSASFTFRLVYKDSRAIPISATQSIITTDGFSDLVDLYQRVPIRNSSTLVWVGTFSAPFRITVTTLPS